MAFGLATGAGGLAAAAGIGAAGGLLSTGVQGLVNYGLQKDAQAFNAEEALKQRQWSSNEAALNRDFNSNEAQKARDFNEYMARNGVQMHVDDLKKAGINPALAGGFSSSASGGVAGYGVNASSGSSASSASNFISAPNFASNALSRAILENVDWEDFSKDFISNSRQAMKIQNEGHALKADIITGLTSDLKKQGFNASEIDSIIKSQFN